MKPIRCTCPSCGAKLSLDADNKTLTCPYCGEVVLIDDETIHVKHDNMEQVGYEFEKGRQKAIKEESVKQKANLKVKEDKNESRNKTLMGILVILLAIMFFPLIVTIYLVKEKKFQPKIRYAIIAVCWIAWMPLAYTWIQNKNVDHNKATETTEVSTIKMIDVQGQTLDVAINNLKEIGIKNIKSVDENGEDIYGQKDCYVVSVQSVSVNEEIGQETEVKLVAQIQEPPLMENFITRLQENLGTEITDVVDFDPHDSASEYYRTEFRLGAYNGSFGKHGYINGLPISMVQYGSHGGFYKTNTSFRVYAQFNENEIDTIYPALVKAYNPDASDESIQAKIDKYKDGGEISFNTGGGYYMSIISYNEETGRVLEVMFD